MSTPFDDDPTDETLSRGLSALAPSEFELDADQTLGAMRPALHRARMRRRLAVSTSVLGVFVVFAAGAVVLQDQSDSRVNIEGPTQTTVSTPATTPRSTTPNTSSTTTRTTPTTQPDNNPGTTQGNPGPGGPQPTTPGSTPGTNGGNTTPTSFPAPSTKTYNSQGGQVTIRFANGSLTLVSQKANAGFTAEVHTNKPDDIEVRFSNGDDESRIRVRVQGGQAVPEISE